MALHSLIQNVVTGLFHNQNMFASGGLLLMAVGAVGAALRKIPAAIWRTTLRQVTVSVTITDDSQAFDYFRHWFQSHEDAHKCRRIDAFTPTIGSEHHIYPAPAPGVHYIWYKRRPMRISFTRSDDKKNTYVRSESFFIQTVGRKQKFLMDFLQSTQAAYRQAYKKVPRLYTARQTEWESVDGFAPRPLNSVILPANDKEGIVKDIQTFRASKDWYDNVGMPYRRGYLLSGLPGTGKTSLVTGLAHEFSMRVYVVALSQTTDDVLATLCRKMDANSILLMEDIDAAVASRQNTATPTGTIEKPQLIGVTLSGLLNAIDGIGAPSGALLFMTSNYPERLDSALVRPGRCDVTVTFGPATPGQKEEIYSRFFPEQEREAARVFAATDKSVTMADVQNVLQSLRARV